MLQMLVTNIIVDLSSIVYIRFVFHSLLYIYIYIYSGGFKGGGGGGGGGGGPKKKNSFWS